MFMEGVPLSVLLAFFREQSQPNEIGAGAGAGGGSNVCRKTKIKATSLAIRSSHKQHNETTQEPKQIHVNGAKSRKVIRVDLILL